MDEHWWEDDEEADRLAFGMVLHLKDGRWIVHRALAGSPAEQAGIVSGDEVASIAGLAGPHISDRNAFTTHFTSMSSEASHEVQLLNAGETRTVSIQPKTIRELYSVDAEQGGATLGGCLSCPSCYRRASGVYNCSDCPGYNCTTG